jgi:putative spermidine/putrescine transport system substrate-binding protein
MQLKIAILSAFAVTLAALGPAVAASPDKGQVVIATMGGSYGDALREAIFKPFEKATGIKVVEATGPFLPKLRAMVESGSPEWDVVEALPGDFGLLSREGLLERLDYSEMDRNVFADFPKEAVQPTGVGTMVYATVIAFNTEKYSQANAPKSWSDVWDVKKFPGPRILFAGAPASSPAIEIAYLADGASPERLYPIDFKRAYAALSRVKPQVVKWATTPAMIPEALSSGEAVLGPAALGRIQLAKEQGAPVDYVWNQATTAYSYWAVLKGAKNTKNAQKFIEFASRAENQAALAKLFLVGPLNKKAFDLIPVDRAKLLPTYPANKIKTIPLNASWWSTKDSSGKTNLEINSAIWNVWMQQ